MEMGSILPLLPISPQCLIALQIYLLLRGSGVDCRLELGVNRQRPGSKGIILEGRSSLPPIDTKACHVASWILSKIYNLCADSYQSGTARLSNVWTLTDFNCKELRRQKWLSSSDIAI